MGSGAESKSLFFLTLGLCIVWLILDSFMGKNYLATFLNNLFPWLKSE